MMIDTKQKKTSKRCLIMTVMRTVLGTLAGILVTHASLSKMFYYSMTMFHIIDSKWIFNTHTCKFLT